MTKFTTDRDELFRSLCLDVPSGFVETKGKQGPDREYHMTVKEWLAAFYRFCEEKEAEASA